MSTKTEPPFDATSLRWRLALRHGIHRLPESSQRWIRRATDTIRGRDYARVVQRARLIAQADLDAIAARERRQPGRKRVLVSLLQQFPPVTNVACGLATALRLRGHDVRGVWCDGIVPRCELNLGGFERPPCAVCADGSSRYEAAYGLACTRLTQWLTAADRAEIDHILARTSDDALERLVVSGVDVGRIAARELRRHRRGYVFAPATDVEYRPWIASAMLIVRLAERLVASERPEILIVSSGRTLLASCLTAVARARQVHVVSWDLENSHPDGLIFSHGEPAVLLPLDAAWESAAAEALSDTERDRLIGFLRRWAASDGTPHPYNPRPMADEAAVRRHLALRPGTPLVVAFANAAWDMAAVDRDVGFSSMFAWLFAVVEYAAAHPEIDLVVRAHPAEVRVSADLRSRTPVITEIRARFGSLPANVTLVPGDSPVSSYVLADMAQVPMMYATRLGLELAVRGQRAWLAGATTYRGRGFTRDVRSRAEMDALLDARTYDERLAPEEIARAERFAYLWFFRYVTRVPVLRPTASNPAPCAFRDLAPGRDAVVDRLCEAIVEERPFVDLHTGNRVYPRVKFGTPAAVNRG